MPHLISWNITQRCNLRCPHCYIDASPFEARDELTSEEGLKLIDEIAQLNSDAMLILTGGEPLLRGDILELTRSASKRGLTVVLGTNGVLLNEQSARGLAQSGIGSVGISLDSMHPGVHDAFRGAPGSWQSAVRGIKACKEVGLPFQIQTTVTQTNYNEIPALLEYSYSLGARAFLVFFLVCTGRGERLTDITPMQYERMLSYIGDIQGQYDSMVVRPRCAPHFARIVYERSRTSGLLGQLLDGCPAGIGYFRISPNGDVTPCPYMPLTLGNVKNESLADIWHKSEVLAKLRNRDNLKGRCGYCEFRNFCGGCRARAYAFTADYLAEEPWCTYAPLGGKCPVPSMVFESARASKTSVDATLPWTKEALELVRFIPPFVRGMVTKRVESFARDRGYSQITAEVLSEAKSKRRNRGFHHAQ